MSAANRGKETEKAVEAWLKVLNAKHARFAWLRLPDARMGRGRIPAMPSDYLVQVPAGMTFLEVKEIEHDFRVPWRNIPQLAALKKWHMAGARTAILIRHSTTNMWRCVDASWLETISTGSWDLSQYPTFHTPAEAFNHVYKDAL